MKNELKNDEGKSIIHLSPMPIFKVSAARKFLFANPAGMWLLEELGLALGDSVPKPMHHCITDVIENGSRHTVNIQTKRGTMYAMTISPTMSYSSVSVFANEVHHSIPQPTDVTSPSPFQQMVETSADSHLVTDILGTVVYANPSTRKYLDADTDRITSRHISMLARMDYREQLKSQIENQISLGNEGATYEFPAAVRQGEETWLAMKVSMVKENDHYNALHIHVRDVTSVIDLKTSNKQLTKELNRLQNKLILGSIQLDNEDRITNVEDQFLQFTGYDRKELIGANFTQKVATGNYKSVLSLNNLRRMMNKTSNYEVEIKNSHGKTMRVGVQATPILNESSQVIGSLATHYLSGRG